MSETPEEHEPAADEDDAPTPFDHPLFLPALLFAGALWFGYDGFLNADYQPGGDKHDSLDFSRYGFAVLLALLGYYGYRGLQEIREDRAAARGDQRPDPID